MINIVHNLTIDFHSTDELDCEGATTHRTGRDKFSRVTQQWNFIGPTQQNEQEQIIFISLFPPCTLGETIFTQEFLVNVTITKIKQETH